MKKLYSKLTIILSILLLPSLCFADLFVPEFDKMQNLHCDIEETVYNQDGSTVSKSKKFRNFKLDDEFSKIYIQKEPIDNITKYDNETIEFRIQTLTDDSIVQSEVKINRQTNEYFANSSITYDNELWGIRTSESLGICKIVN